MKVPRQRSSDQKNKLRLRKKTSTFCLKKLERMTQNVSVITLMSDRQRNKGQLSPLSRYLYLLRQLHSSSCQT